MSTMATSTNQSESDPAAPTDPSAPTPLHVEQHDETVLSDDAQEKVKSIALNELPGGTVVAIETDADGAAYVARMLDADGTAMTVYLDESFDVLDLG
jgi:uncharacterized membrane protein YkoI